MDWTALINGLAGGILLGLSAFLLLLLTGRIAGISGILGSLVTARPVESIWRGLFLAGMICGGLVYQLLPGDSIAFELQLSNTWIIVAGLLVGIGTRLGSGCTSGHGVCGIARLSRRSITATCVFIGIAMLTVYLTRHELAIIP